MRDSASQSLLLHSCCAPCTIIPLELLRQGGYRPVAFFYNPNIQPRSEYQKRLETLQGYAQTVALELLLVQGACELWWQRVGKFGGPFPLIAGSPNYELNQRLRRHRCSACSGLRQERLAQAARARGFAEISTSLLLSPYQEIAKIQSLLQSLAAHAGLLVHASDWREYYPEARQRSAALGLYSQNYCGCGYSREEAKIERAARREQVRARRRQVQNTSTLAARAGKSESSDADSGL